jgi:hypothetical protein
VWLTLCALLSTSPVWAQQHILDSSMLQQAVAATRATDEANRQVVQRVLSRSDVSRVAEAMGLDVKDARSALGTMTSAELADLAQPARALEADLAGGATTITISITTLLLVLILIAIIAS